MIRNDTQCSHSRWRTSNTHTWTEIHFRPSICTDPDRKRSSRIPPDSRCPHGSNRSRNLHQRYQDLSWSYWDSSEAVRCAVVQRCSLRSEVSHHPSHTPAELPRRPRGSTRRWSMRFYSTASQGRHDTPSDLEKEQRTQRFKMKDQIISFKMSSYNLVCMSWLNILQLMSYNEYILINSSY